MRRVRLRVALSLDGFIADINGGVEWLHRFHDKGLREDYGITKFFREIDTVLMGRHTHDFALSHGMASYPGMQNFVFTRSKPAGKRDGVEYISGNPAEAIAALKAFSYLVYTIAAMSKPSDCVLRSDRLESLSDRAL